MSPLPGLTACGLPYLWPPEPQLPHLLGTCRDWMGVGGQRPLPDLARVEWPQTLWAQVPLRMCITLKHKQY